MKLSIEKGIDFEMIYKRHFNSIYLFCHSLINDRQAGLDLAQNAFLRLWERWDAEQYNEQSTLAFLYITARNLCYDQLKGQHYTESIDGPAALTISDDTLFLDAITLQETKRHLYEMIKRLSKRKREIILLSITGKNNSEIADTLQVSVNTIKTLKKEAYSQLRQLLKDDFFLLTSLLII